MKNRNLKNSIEDKIEKSDATAAIISSFKVLLSASGIGSPIATLISEFIPSQRFLRLEKFVEQLSEDLKNYNDSVIKDYINTNEFAFIFEQCFRAVIENYHQEKINLYKSILINSMIENHIIQEEKEFFLNLTKQLTITHIKILKFLSDPFEYITQLGLKPEDIRGNWNNFLPILFPDIDYEIIKTAFDDLANYGLININSSMFSTMTTKSGYARIEETSKFSEFGEKYFSYVTANE